MVDRSDEPGLERIICEECRVCPQAYWDSEIGTIVLVCSCGERVMPRNAVIEHDLMPDGTNWTVLEEDGDRDD